MIFRLNVIIIKFIVSIGKGLAVIIIFISWIIRVQVIFLSFLIKFDIDIFGMNLIKFELVRVFMRWADRIDIRADRKSIRFDIIIHFTDASFVIHQLILYLIFEIKNRINIWYKILFIRISPEHIWKIINYNICHLITFNKIIIINLSG